MLKLFTVTALITVARAGQCSKWELDQMGAVSGKLADCIYDAAPYKCAKRFIDISIDCARCSSMVVCEQMVIDDMLTGCDMKQKSPCHNFEKTAVEKIRGRCSKSFDLNAMGKSLSALVKNKIMDEYEREFVESVLENVVRA